jgi:hypothetical protein
MSKGAAHTQVENITCPVAGQIGVFSVSGSAGSVDLRTIGPQPALGNEEQNGCCDRYVELQADGGDVYVIFGATQAAVTSANAPVISTTGANAAGAAMRIPNGTSKQYRPTNNGSPWCGYIGTGSGTVYLRIAASSN